MGINQERFRGEEWPNELIRLFGTEVLGENESQKDHAIHVCEALYKLGVTSEIYKYLEEGNILNYFVVPLSRVFDGTEQIYPSYNPPLNAHPDTNILIDYAPLSCGYITSGQLGAQKIDINNINQNEPKDI